MPFNPSGFEATPVLQPLRAASPRTFIRLPTPRHTSRFALTPYRITCHYFRRRKNTEIYFSPLLFLHDGAHKKTVAQSTPPRLAFPYQRAPTLYITKCFPDLRAPPQPPHPPPSPPSPSARPPQPGEWAGEAGRGGGVGGRWGERAAGVWLSLLPSYTLSYFCRQGKSSVSW